MYVIIVRPISQFIVKYRKQWNQTCYAQYRKVKVAEWTHTLTLSIV